MDQLTEVLAKASKEELSRLAEFLESDSPTPIGIIDSLGRASLGKRGRILGSTRPSYADIVAQVAKKLKISTPPISEEETERLVTIKVLNMALEKMTPQQSNELEAKLKKEAHQLNMGDLKSLAAGVAIPTGALFGQMACQLLLLFPRTFLIGWIAQGLLGLIAGPLGWVATGAWVVWKLTGPEYKRLIPAIAFIGGLRSKYSNEGI